MLRTFCVFETEHDALVFLDFINSRLGLVTTVVDRAYKIKIPGQLSFHNDVKNLTFILRKNLFPLQLIEKVINQYTTRAHNGSRGNTQSQSSAYVQYFKLAYVGSFSTEARRKQRKLASHFCRDLDIKLVLTSFKIRNMFSRV